MDRRARLSRYIYSLCVLQGSQCGLLLLYVLGVFCTLLKSLSRLGIKIDTTYSCLVPRGYMHLGDSAEIELAQPQSI